VSYQYRAVEKFWRNFYKLSLEQKESVRRAWQTFKRDPFHPSFRSHEIHELSARAKHTIYSAVIESDLRVIFRIDDRWVTSLDVGSHKIYRQ
jgi:mRNA-degrading endonuclease YafQ of YafQ-DinJ toxin-antitoxin module